MIVLEMYLDDQLIDTIQPSVWLMQKNYLTHVKELMGELKKKHASHLSSSNQQPVFILSGVPSRINFFKPLQYNKDFGAYQIFTPGKPTLRHTYPKE